MSTDERALLQAIWDDPEEDVPRLVYADWLEETGEPARLARAEFIRVQIEKTLVDEFDPRREELTAREQGLLVRFGDVWRGRLATIVHHPTHVFFHRGFPEAWVCGSPTDVLARSEPLAGEAPTW